MNTWKIEYTDTFGGEANYCWVKRDEITLPDGLTNSQIKRAAKKQLDLSGVPGRWNDFGDFFEFRPYNSATVLFITYDYS